MFIELTMTDNKKILVNVNAIEIVNVDAKDRTIVNFVTDPHMHVRAKESYDQVKELIKNEVAAERGY